MLCRCHFSCAKGTVNFHTSNVGYKYAIPNSTYKSSLEQKAYIALDNGTIDKKDTLS